MGRRKKQPWERQTKESDPAWEAFCIYRDMPEETGQKRSCQRVAQRLSKSNGMVKRWCKNYDWINRVAEYDEYREEIEIEERIKAQKKRIQDVEKMDQRHINLAVQLQRQVLNKIREATESDVPLDTKEIESLTRALKNLTEIERTAMHATSADKQIELNREMFEYKKEQDGNIVQEEENEDVVIYLPNIDKDSDDSDEEKD